ncbi:MAG: CPBP family glutamic-type intramembrane protease [Dehalococcoidia bacterium]|jgi:membrane protease YdiL (CAAX protease family)
MKVNITDILRWEPLPFWLYFIAIAVTEALTVYLYPLAGVIIYSIMMIGFIIQSAFITDPLKRNLVLAFSLIPMVRILSLLMPLGQLSLIYRFPIIYLPLLAATITVMWVTGLKPIDIGLNLKHWPYQAIGGVISGIAIGALEYLILGSSPLINTLTLKEFWLPALILLITTGLVEELIFRGVLQKFAVALMGRWGIILISLIFATLHMGFYAWGDVVFVFLVALFFAFIAKMTRSLLGVILSHGTANVILFLVAPFVLS